MTRLERSDCGPSTAAGDRRNIHTSSSCSWSAGSTLEISALFPRPRVTAAVPGQLFYSETPLLAPPFLATAVERIPYLLMPLPPRDHRIQVGETPSALRAIARRARSASDGLLVACAVVGLVGATAVVVLWPASWPLALPGLTLAGFGGWGVTDRAVSELSDSAELPASALRALRFLRLASALIGVAALVGFLLVASTRTGFTAGSGWF